MIVPSMYYTQEQCANHAGKASQKAAFCSDKNSFFDA
jgi:hypothetical protein